MAKKILVVDDEPDVLTYLTAVFQDNGFDVLSAVNGKECMEKTRNHIGHHNARRIGCQGIQRFAGRPGNNQYTCRHHYRNIIRV